MRLHTTLRAVALGITLMAFFVDTSPCAMSWSSCRSNDQKTPSCPSRLMTGNNLPTVLQLRGGGEEEGDMMMEEHADDKDVPLFEAFGKAAEQSPHSKKMRSMLEQISEHRSAAQLPQLPTCLRVRRAVLT